MLKLYATLTAYGAFARHHLEDRARERTSRGSVTIENVLWAVAVIAIVGIVVVAIRAFVTREAGKIN
jgi:heme/copper-type cytochrome/quinol oxidase subunit 2